MDYKWMLIGCWKDRIFYTDVEFQEYIRTNIFNVPVGVSLYNCIDWLAEHRPEFTIVRVELDYEGDRVIHSVYGDIRVNYMACVNRVDNTLRGRIEHKTVVLR